MYEEAVKIPLVVKMPGGKTGRTDTLVSHLDIKPTLCEMIGAEASMRWNVSYAAVPWGICA